MSYAAASIIGMVSCLVFLYVWGQRLDASSLWGQVLRFLSVTVPVGLLLPVLTYVVSLNNTLTPETPTAAMLAASQTFYTVYFWVFLVFISFLSVSFAIEVLSSIGGRRRA